MYRAPLEMSDHQRVCAIHGQYQIDETVFAVGEGTKIRKSASKALSAKLQRLKITNADAGPKAIVKLIGKLLGE